jgi:hypothetical protein
LLTDDYDEAIDHIHHYREKNSTPWLRKQLKKLKRPKGESMQ